ncbi:MAG: nitric oxide synthase NOS, partial [Hapalosiphonaceae cyanobacterium JJU2]
MHNILVFASNPQYTPAQQFINLLTARGKYLVQGIKKPNAVVPPSIANTVEWYSTKSNSLLDVKDIFQGCDTACMFVMPADIVDTRNFGSLQRTFIDAAVEAGARRLAWVAPACPDGSELGKRLTAAEELVRSADIETLVLRHAPLFSDLLDQKKELKFRRTLSLPLGSSALPWLAPEIIAQGLYKWVQGEVNNQSPEVLTGPVQLSGGNIAQEISSVLEQNLKGYKFAQRLFASIDVDSSGQIDPQEIFPYLLELGYSNDEAQHIIKEADKDKSGAIDFREFMHGLEEHLDAALVDVPTQVQYVNIPKATALYDLMNAGIDENTAKARLGVLTGLSESGLSEQNQDLQRWLGRSNISLRDWADQYILDLINVYILPGRGILSISEGIFDGQPALITRLLQANGRILLGRRTLDNKTVEIQWADEDFEDAEVISYQPEGGGERVLKLKEERLVSLSARGSWTGRRLATQLFFQNQPLPRWQVALFRELGELQMEEVSTTGAADEVICNCTQITCGKLQELIDSGNDTIDKIGELTQVTRICGGCQALVEELLGSSSLAVGELVSSQNLGRGMFKFEFRPVGKEVVASQPGQHILIQGRVDNRWVTRAYTLSSAADQTDAYEITVKREELGLFSRWLCDRASNDSLFRISDPRGEFILDQEDSAFFFAGGIGVTPAISMMRTLANRGDHQKLHLDYCAPYPEDLIFQPELEQLSAAHANLTFTLRPTRQGGRLSAEQVQTQYPYTEGTVAFICGPQAYMDAVRGYLKQAGWPNVAIREELFSSKLDDDGNAQRVVPKRPAVQLAGGITPVEHDSFNVGAVGSVMEEAEVFLKQCYLEQGLNEVFLPRWQEVKASIEQTGTYEQTYDELTYGARLAWRNSSRCIGRYFWQSLHVRDMRHLETEEEMFQAIIEHMKYATNEGDLRATMTVFKPDGRRLWNVQLLRYAGYRQPDGTILGDPANVELTEYAFKMGWSSPNPKTSFDYLPIIIQLLDKQPKVFDIPPEVILDVPLEHPRYDWFAEFGLKWYALPAVSNMVFDIGGIQYMCAPFNGFYMGTEIGGRNFSDTYRYNMLPKIAEKMGLDTSSDSTLWKDSALVELNIAVLDSFNKHNVRLLDHHTMGDYFIKFVDEEKRCGRSLYADWTWIIPPVSGSTSKAWPMEMENRILKPNYFYAPEPWKTVDQTQGCPF